MRAFASRTDKDLFIGATLAFGWLLVILIIVGFTGIIAVWAGGVAQFGPIEEWSSSSFFYLIDTLPSWVVGFTLCLVVSLSTAVFDSLQSAMISTASNDLFRNKLPLIYIRAAIVLFCIPVIVVAVKADASILQIFLISDLVSAAAMPSLLLGLWDKVYFINGIDTIIGGCGGILTVFIFGTIYYGSAQAGGALIAISTLYVDDWGVFGAYVCAPVGGLIFTFLSFFVRLALAFAMSKVANKPFTIFDRPVKRYSEESDQDVAPELVSADSEVVSAAGRHNGKPKTHLF